MRSAVCRVQLQGLLDRIPCEAAEARLARAIGYGTIVFFRKQLGGIQPGERGIVLLPLPAAVVSILTVGEIFPLLVCLDCFPAFQVRVRLFSLVQSAQSFREAIERLAPVGLNLDRGSVGGGGFFPEPQGFAGDPEIGMSPGIARLLANFSPEGLDGVFMSLHM